MESFLLANLKQNHILQHFVSYGIQEQETFLFFQALMANQVKVRFVSSKPELLLLKFRKILPTNSSVTKLWQNL